MLLLLFALPLAWYQINFCSCGSVFHWSYYFCILDCQFFLLGIIFRGLSELHSSGIECLCFFVLFFFFSLVAKLIAKIRICALVSQDGSMCTVSY